MKKIMKERGQSLVELAVSLVILLYLLSGAAEFGVLFFQYVQLRDAAQEGALYGSMNPYIDSNGDGTFDAGEPVNQAGIETRVRGASSSPINLNDTSKVTVLASGDGSYCEGHAVQVTVSFDHQIFMPFMARLLGRSSNPVIPLSASVTDTIL